MIGQSVDNNGVGLRQLAIVLGAVSAASVMVVASVSAKDHGAQPKQAMFKTKAEAEAAAPDFGCTGAHPMGDMWMVCEQHNHHKTN